MEAFVYCWTNHTKGNKYIGYHKGTPNDGYICSSASERFWADWEIDDWSRQIVAEGTVEDCVALEFAILKSLDLKLDEWYNNNAGGGIVFTEEVRAKMRREFPEEHKKKLSDAKKGKKISKAHANALHKGRKNSKNSKEHNEAISKFSKGRIASEETKKKQSEARLKNENRFVLATKAGKASANKLTPEQRSERSRQAALKRWGKK